MKRENDTNKYLPLSEATTYIMLALVTPLHGYGIMQQVQSFSEGTVTLGPGTLYGVLTSLEKERLIIKVREEERRKVYTLTEIGLSVLREQIARLAIMARMGQKLLK
jgi:DNA-binding PadR family transcriptional regulator